jgi:hypothetical protein
LVTAGGTTGSNTVTVTWNTAGPQTVSIQYNGLPSPSVLNVTVNAAFTVGSASANQTVCYNTAPVLLTGIAPTGGITPYTYQWQSSTDNITFTDVPGATGITYQPGALLVTTYYRQNQISAGGCGTFPTNVLTITVVQPPPTLTTITNMTIVSAQHFCADAAQTLTVGDNVTTFHVLNGGVVNLIAGQNIIILPSTIVDPGGYLHAFITTNCFWCSAYPLPSMVTAQPDTTVNEIQVIPFVDKSTSNFFKVYPNPTTGAFTLELSEVPETSVVKVEIYGIYGGKVQNEEFTGQNKHEFTLAGNPTGIYFIRVYCNGNLGTQKIIKQ